MLYLTALGGEEQEEAKGGGGEGQGEDGGAEGERVLLTLSLGCGRVQGMLLPVRQAAARED